MVARDEHLCTKRLVVTSETTNIKHNNGFFSTDMVVCYTFISFMQEAYIEAKEILDHAKRVLILSHRHPDADTIGANLALRQALESPGKSVVSACIDPLPQNSLFLKDAEKFVQDFPPKDFDVFVTVDCGAHYMTRFHEKYPEILEKKIPLINIDHHASNDLFGTVNIVDIEAASATQVLFQFLKFLQIPLDQHIATCLLHGLYFDTGSFMHSNVTPEVLRIASELMWQGADFRRIVKEQFQTMPISQLKIYGRVFDRISITPRKLTRSFITHRDYQECGAKPEDTTGAIDYLNAIPDGRFCSLISHDGDGKIKGSFRTRDDSIDLSKLAGLLGGGGHKKAAGFSIPGKLSIDGMVGGGEINRLHFTPGGKS